MPTQCTKPRLLLTSAAALALLAGATSAGAAGYATDEISVEGLGRANAGQAAAQGAGAVFSNPASIARSGRELSLGAHRRFNDVEFRNSASTITLPVPPAGLTIPVGGASSIDGMPDQTLPYGAVAVPIGDAFAVGLSVSRPFSLKTELGAAAFPRYDTIRSKIEVTEVQATGAWQATEWLDVGLGVLAQHNDAYLDQAYPNVVAGASDAISRLKADGWNYGWTAGVQAHVESVHVGLSYRSHVKQDLDGSLALSGLVGPLAPFNFAAPAKVTFTLPSQLSLALRWQATPALTISGQVDRVGWAKYDVIDVAFGGQTVGVPQEFKDTTAVALGADYVLNPMWTLRGGVRVEPTATPDSLREPGVPDADSILYALGASAKLTDAATVNAALAYKDYSSSNLTDNDVFYAGTPAQTVAATRGSFSGSAVSLSLGLDWRF